MGRKSFSKEIKAKAIGMVHGGMSVKDVAAKFKTTDNSIRTWIRIAQNSGFLKPGKPTSQIKNSDYVDPDKNFPVMVELQNEIKELKEENAILLRIIKRRN